MSTTRTETMRQSDRVTLRLEVEAAWFATDGTAVRQPAKTLLVSRNGGVLRLAEQFFPGQEITLHRKMEGDQTKTARARIMAEIDREPDGFIYAVAIIEPRTDFWDIEFHAKSGRGVGAAFDGMQFLPEARGRVPQRYGAEIVRGAAVYRAIVQAL